MDGEDVRVVEGGDGARLALESAEPLGIGGGIVGRTLSATSARGAHRGPGRLAHASRAEGAMTS